MYLLVVVTLIIAVIGTYTQVVGLQTARMFSSQHSIASTMMQWHAAAVSMAASIIKTNPGAYSPSGCSLTFKPPPGSLMLGCPSPQLYNNEYDMPQANGGTLTDAFNQLNRIYSGNISIGNECVHLPSHCTAVDTPGFGCASGACSPLYDTANFQFYSVLYQSPGGTQDLVITFVQAPASPIPGYLSLLSGKQINVTSADLLQQLQRLGLYNFSYGTINGNNQLVTGGGTYSLGQSMQSVTLINGAVAVISSPDGY